MIRRTPSIHIEQNLYRIAAGGAGRGLLGIGDVHARSSITRRAPRGNRQRRWRGHLPLHLIVCDYPHPMTLRSPTQILTIPIPTRHPRVVVLGTGGVLSDLQRHDPLYGRSDAPSTPNPNHEGQTHKKDKQPRQTNNPSTHLGESGQTRCSICMGSPRGCQPNSPRRHRRGGRGSRSRSEQGS